MVFGVFVNVFKSSTFNVLFCKIIASMITWPKSYKKKTIGIPTPYYDGWWYGFRGATCECLMF